MSDNMNKPNPKALKLEGLERINKKVTIGFKCHPQLKIHLANEAKKAGLTLSEFVEALIQQLDAALQLEKKDTEKLKQQLAFYEGGILLEFYKDHKNQELSYINSSGKEIKLIIKEPKDMFTVMINSFKTRK
jgi:hypothetical protein